MRSQRSRLMRAVADAMAERGYAGTTVADILRHARVSRETFYEQFSSKQDCFIAAYEEAAAAVMALLEHEAATPGTPVERFDRTIETYLNALAAEPTFARLFMIEVYSGGERVLATRAEIEKRFAELVIDAFEPQDPTARFACEALVAAIITMVTTCLAANDPDRLRALRQPLTELIQRGLGAPGASPQAE